MIFKKNSNQYREFSHNQNNKSNEMELYKLNRN